ncbi:MAG: iron hydrogenase small subunit, partial [Candidatus Cloacimonadota bacterium]|nr:iron hydrogenase small subunit [Candidatus Cloacimonadota bacterium]
FGSNLADRARRGMSLYKEDSELPLRCSHCNPEVNRVYEEYLGAPNSEKAHKLLHTYYFQRSTTHGQAEKEVTHKH